MRVVVVGGGGREHALVHSLARTADVVATPGNPGIASVAECIDTPAEELTADLFVIGPEAPLADGLADRLRAQGKLVFGPGADGARFEASKTWMKAFFDLHRIPTANHGAFTDLASAVEFLKSLPGPYVVKADGLTAGKGVLVTDVLVDAVEDARQKLEGSFGNAGRVVIEEFLDGPEITVLALCDGTTVTPLAPAQDHKRIFDGDTGPNTGGMGAYSPVPAATPQVLKQVFENILRPTVAGLCEERIDYRGVLYAQFIATDRGPKMVEYNVRFGDPEAQVVLPRLQGDLAQLLAECASGALTTRPSFTDDAAVTVVLATAGYPDEPRSGDEIFGLDDAQALPGITIFHAGTALDEHGRLVTAGGRVLDVTATAPTLREARDRAYEAITRIRFEGMQYRTDIGASALVSTEGTK